MSNMRRTIWVLKSVSRVPSSAVDDSPHSGNDAFLGSQSTFMPGLIGRYIDDDEDQHVVPYDWGTPVLGDGSFEEGAVSSRGYDYRQRLDEAYAQATLNSPLGGDWAHSTEGLPCQPNVVIEEPIPVVDRKGKGKQRMFPDDFLKEPFTLDGLQSLTEQFQDLNIGGDTKIGHVSECPSTATRQLSALLNRDGFSASDAAPVRTTNIFSSNSFQLNYLSEFDQEPFYYRLLHRGDPGIDSADPNWAENRLKELRMQLKQRTKEPKWNFTPRTPVKSKNDKGVLATECPYSLADREELSPLVGCDSSNQDPFALP